MRWAAAAASLLLLLASGCASEPDPAGAGGTPPSGSGAPGDGPTTSAQPGPSPPPAASAPAGPTTWFLHITPGGSEPSCATARFHMDRNDTAGDCDGYGCALPAVPPPPGVPEGDCSILRFPANGTPGPRPAGAHARGTLFIGAYGPARSTLEVRLLANGTDIGGVLQEERLLLPNGIGTYHPFPFAFATTAPIGAGANLELHVSVHTQESFTLGLEGDHASQFTLR